MKTMLKKLTALVFTLILLTAAFPVAGLATSETSDNLLAALNPGFETEGFSGAGVQITGETALDTDAHSGSYSLKMGSEGKIWLPNFPVKQQTKYTLSFWMKNSVADAIKFWGANNPIRNDNGGTKLGNLPDMVYGKAHAGDDIKWREVSFSFVTPEGAAMMDIAINVNALDEHLKVDDISLVECDTNNLLWKNNSDFDTVYGSTGLDLGTAKITDKVSHSGTKSVSLSDGYIKYWNFPIKPSTSYTLSFWMQNSIKDSIKFWAANNGFFNNGYSIGSSLPDMVFGEAHEGDDIKWREVRINFTSPANADGMNIAINAHTAVDPNLYIDDLSLVECDTRNLLWNHNADFDSTISAANPDLGTAKITDKVSHSGTKSVSLSDGFIKYYNVPIKASTNYTLSFWMQNSIQDGIKFWYQNNYFYKNGAITGYHLPEMVFGDAHEGDDIKWREVRINFTSPPDVNGLNIAMNANTAVDPYCYIDDVSLVETGNSNLQYLGGVDGSTTEFVAANVFAGLSGKRYKISFSQNLVSGTPAVSLTYDGPIFQGFPAASGNNTWEDYTMYLQGTPSDSLWFKSFDLDNVTVIQDNNCLAFYKDIELYYTGNPANRHIAYGSTGNIFTTEKAVKASTLSDINAVDGFRTVKTRAHVIPKETEAGTFNREEVTLLTAVYKYDKNGNKSLVTVNIATDASSDGKVLDAVGTVQVPENTQDATYKVEAVAWNSVDGMKALFEKKVLEN